MARKEEPSATASTATSTASAATATSSAVAEPAAPVRPTKRSMEYRGVQVTLMEKVPADFLPRVNADGFLVLHCATQDAFVKNGTSKLLQTGVKVVVPDGQMLVVAQCTESDPRRLSVRHYYLSGESAEIVVDIVAQRGQDLPIRFGSMVAALWLVDGPAVGDKLAE